MSWQLSTWEARARESVEYLYRLGLVPATAYLPAPVAYRVACLRGDLEYRREHATGQQIQENLQRVLGEALSPAERAEVAREYFRLHHCAAMDELRLRQDGHRRDAVVEFRGLEHLERALANGHGALLCTAHFGSYRACFAYLGARGLPVTAVKRMVEEPAPMSDLDRASMRLFEDAINRHMRRPNINPLAGPFAAAHAAKVLRQNELLGVYVDAPALPADKARTVTVPFLGHEAALLTGSLVVAASIGAPVFVALLHRSADRQHQVFEISEPMPAGEQPAVTLQRCMAIIEAAVRQSPADWLYWGLTDDLKQLGVLAPATPVVAACTA